MASPAAPRRRSLAFASASADSEEDDLPIGRGFVPPEAAGEEQEPEWMRSMLKSYKVSAVPSVARFRCTLPHTQL